MLFRHLWVNTEIRAEKNFTQIRPYFTQHKHTRGFVKPCVKNLFYPLFSTSQQGTDLCQLCIQETSHVIFTSVYTHHYMTWLS